jgi:DNA adenine methylase
VGSIAFKEAARFIYLNRTCFNGMYRENLRGQFNVPRGTKDTVVFPIDDFASVARSLSRASLRSADFEHAIEKAKRGDFVFIDPPYTVRHNQNGFVKYNQRIFTWEDQERLCAAAFSAAKRGVRCLVTNANHPSIRKLYREADALLVVGRPSVMAGGLKGRGESTEIACTIGYVPRHK